MTEKANTNPAAPKRWRYKERDRNNIKRKITSELQTDKGTIQSPEDLTKSLQAICEKTLGRQRPNARKGKPWWSKRIADLRSELISAKRALTRSNKKTRGNPDPELVKSYATSYQNLREEIKISKERLHERLCDELDHYPWGDAYRQAIGKLKPRKKCETPKNAAEIINKLFPAHPPVSFEERSSEGLLAFEISEIQEAAKRLKKGKSTGPDGIPAEVIQILAEQSPATLATVMNRLLEKGEFPAIWKFAELRLIPKEGHSKETPKYRPICLLDSLGKLLEHLLKKRLIEELTRTNGISKRQHAYQVGRSTTSAIGETVEFLEKTFKRGPGWTPAIILLDVLNAFNSASWQGILNRLRRLGIKPYLVKIVASYLSERVMVLGDKRYILTSGVPQGSVLGPILWNVLFDEVLKIEMPDNCEITGYADDLALKIAAKNDQEMRHRGNLAMKRVQCWMQKNQLQLAVAKTNAVIVRGRRTSVSKSVKFELNGFSVKPTPKIKYLGVWLDENINFQIHAQAVAEDATQAFNCLAAILSKSTVRMAKRRIIASVVEAKLLYGCEVWFSRMPGCAFKVLETVQRNAALRIIQGFPTISADAAFVLSGMVPIRIKAEARSSKHRTGLRATDEQIARKWQTRWDKADSGAWTRRLIPNIQMWTKRRHGELTHTTTQFLSGHGAFASHLYQMNRAPSATCKSCNNKTETAEHLLFHCDSFASEREADQRTKQLTADTIINKMTENIATWSAVESLMDNMIKARK